MYPPDEYHVPARDVLRDLLLSNKDTDGQERAFAPRRRDEENQTFHYFPLEGSLAWSPRQCRGFDRRAEEERRRAEEMRSRVRALFLICSLFVQNEEDGPDAWVWFRVGLSSHGAEAVEFVFRQRDEEEFVDTFCGGQCLVRSRYAPYQGYRVDVVFSPPLRYAFLQVRPCRLTPDCRFSFPVSPESP